MGGLETVIMDLCRSMDKGRFTLHVLCLCQYDEDYKAQLESQGVEVHVIKRRARGDLSFFIRITALMKSRRIDVVHAHSGCFFNMALCAAVARVPVRLFTEHGLPLDNEGLPMNTGLKARCEDLFTGAIATRVYGVSDEIVKNLSTRMAGQKRKIRHAVNGIDTARFKPCSDLYSIGVEKRRLALPEGPFIIGSVGRLETIKNHALLLEACAQLKAVPVDFHLVLVGDGACRGVLTDQAAELGIDNRVTFAGVQYGIEHLLPVMDMFVLPSLTEGTSISLLEAMACGIPCVASNVGGTPAIIEDGINGVLFEACQADMLAATLKALCNDPERRRGLAINAVRTVAERFSIGTMVAQYESAYSHSEAGKGDAWKRETR